MTRLSGHGLRYEGKTPDPLARWGQRNSPSPPPQPARGLTGSTRRPSVESENYPNDLVHVAVMRRDWESVRDDEDALDPDLPEMPASMVPQVGDSFLSSGQWWRVEVRAWSTYKHPRLAALEPGTTRAWVDLVVTLIGEDPRA